MDFNLIPNAEASITTLVNSISKVIINPIIIFLFSAAIAYFLYGIAQYLMNPDNEEIRKKSKSQMISGIIGLFIMVGVFGIMSLIKNTVGAKNVQIQEGGIVNSSTDYFAKNTGSIDQFTGVGHLNFADCKSSGNVWNVEEAICTSDTGSVNDTSSVLGDTGVGYQASGYLQLTRQIWLIYTGSGIKTTSIGLKSTGSTNYSNGAVGYIDPSSRSTKNSKLIGKYTSDSSYYRVVDSGVNPNLNQAKLIALNNALVEIAKLKGVTSTIGLNYRIIEQTEFPLDKTTGNYDSFIAVESPRAGVVVTPTGGSSTYKPSTGGSSTYR